MQLAAFLQKECYNAKQRAIRRYQVRGKIPFAPDIMKLL